MSRYHLDQSALNEPTNMTNNHVDKSVDRQLLNLK